MDETLDENQRFLRIREHLVECEQAHVLRFWPALSRAQRLAFLDQIESIDLPALRDSLGRALAAPARTPEAISPPPVELRPESGGDASRWQRARECGEELLAAGRVAALVVAGGQATRLGTPGPKGLFPIGPISERSLFEIQAQKLLYLKARYGRNLPWYVMTSPATDAATRSYFEARAYFGLPAEDVCFFEQSMVPTFDLEGKLQLADMGWLMQSPDGHGGSVLALERCGLLGDMERRGISTLFYYQVDNPLIRIADPAFLGFHALADSEISCKVIRRGDPWEKIGVLVQRGSTLGVVEYSELDENQRLAREASGGLLYWAGNPAIHLFETAFLRRIAADAERWLPFHVAAKRIPALDSTGAIENPTDANGYKLERFVFDALPAARRSLLLEAPRDQEFAPVKQSEGNDSPETARAALIACYRSWLQEGGRPVPAGALIEIDHSRIEGPEDVKNIQPGELDEASGLVRIAHRTSGALA